MDNMKSLELTNKAVILLAWVVREWKSWLQKHLECDGGNQEMKGIIEERASKYAWNHRRKQEIEGSRN